MGSDAERNLQERNVMIKHLRRLHAFASSTLRVTWLRDRLCLLLGGAGIVVAESSGEIDESALVRFPAKSDEGDLMEILTSTELISLEDDVIVVRDFARGDECFFRFLAYNTAEGFCWQWTPPEKVHVYFTPIRVSTSQFAFWSNKVIWIVDRDQSRIRHRLSVDYSDADDTGFARVCWNPTTNCLFAAWYQWESTKIVMWDLNEHSPKPQIVGELFRTGVIGCCADVHHDRVMFIVTEEDESTSIHLLTAGDWNSFAIEYSDDIERPKPFCHRDRLYFFSDNGTLLSVDLLSGELNEEHGFAGLRDYSFHNQLGKLAIVDRNGELFVAEL